MKILHVNDNDLKGRRFNGHDMQIELNRRDIPSKQIVMHKYGDDPNTVLLTKEFEEPFLRGYCKNYERESSLHAMIYPYGWRLLESPEFKKADIIHYHLIHNDFISLAMFPDLVKAKPSVLTLHDPWFFTGHCVHPYSCKKWKTGCGECPNLISYFEMKQDKTRMMWNIKRQIFDGLNLNIIVSSDFMVNMVNESPITRNIKNVHKIPFGVSDEFFNDAISREEARKKLKIPEDSFVMFFRETESEFKGLSYISKMLDLLKPPKHVILLTCEEKGLLSKHKKRFTLMELGKVYDAAKLSELYKACDVFLMPSTAESFGLMAVEAMASARPVIVTEGTALPNVTFAPECGISIPQGNVEEFAASIEQLMNSSGECLERGKKGRELASKHYRFASYIDKHIGLYNDIINGNHK